MPLVVTSLLAETVLPLVTSQVVASHVHKFPYKLLKRREERVRGVVPGHNIMAGHGVGAVMKRQTTLASFLCSTIIMRT